MVADSRRARDLNQRELDTLLLFSKHAAEPISSQILHDIPLLKVVSYNELDTYLGFEIDNCESESNRPTGLSIEAFGFTLTNNRYDIIVRLDNLNRLKEMQYVFFVEDFFPQIDLSQVRFYDEPNSHLSYFLRGSKVDVIA